MTRTQASKGFAPILGDNARVLILGSLPGLRSLAEARYYAFPGNAFWPILSALCGIPEQASYEDRCAALIRHRIAVWDVLAAAVRPGSLDSAIRKSDAEVNDFASFFAANPSVQAVFFNGKAASDIFERRVVGSLPATQQSIHRERLPSTSPAFAAATRAEKTSAWHSAIEPWL